MPKDFCHAQPSSAKSTRLPNPPAANAFQHSPSSPSSHSRRQTKLAKSKSRKVAQNSPRMQTGFNPNDPERLALVLAPRGIYNVSNSCFMGSVLQFMKSLSEHLIPIANQSLISSELLQCLSDLTSRNNLPLYPLSFSAISRRHFNFADGSFEDAHEYITGLLQLFDQDPFKFSVMHVVSCLSCNYANDTPEPYFELQLPLSATSLTDCIAFFPTAHLYP